jgi:hypothetical protein
MASLEGQPVSDALIRRATRARIYFRLMDIMLVLSLMGFTEFLLDKVGGIILIPATSPIYPLVSTFFYTMNFFVPTFLILARFMRDEYAELLWRRTATALVYVSAIAPFGLLAIGWVSFLITGQRVSQGAVRFLAESMEFFDAVVVIWMVFMLLFVAIFQLLRWRDAR